MAKHAPVPYLHRHTNVTVTELTEFANAKRGDQLRVLAELRKRAIDDSHKLELTIMGLALTLVAAVIVPQHVDLSKLPLLGSLVAGVLVGVLAVLLLIPVLVTTALRSNRRETATVWLSAYEDELRRCETRTGRKARQWRAQH